MKREDGDRLAREYNVAFMEVGGLLYVFLPIFPIFLPLHLLVSDIRQVWAQRGIGVFGSCQVIKIIGVVVDLIFGRRFLPCQLKVKPNKFLILLVQVGLLSSDNECGMVSHFYLLTIFNSNIFLTNISAYLSYLYRLQATEESEGGISRRCEIQCAGFCEGAHSADHLSQLQFVNGENDRRTNIGSYDNL